MSISQANLRSGSPPILRSTILATPARIKRIQSEAKNRSSDTCRCSPAARLSVKLEVQGVGGWQTVASATTDADGRAAELLSRGAALPQGTYRLWFDTAEYFRAQAVETFYPHVEIVFIVKDATQHYHVALLLAPYSYTTYRGS